MIITEAFYCEHIFASVCRYTLLCVYIVLHMFVVLIAESLASLLLKCYSLMATAAM